MGQSELLEWLVEQRRKTPKFFTFKELAEALPQCKRGLRRTIGKLRRCGLVEFTYGEWYDYKLRVRAKER